MGFAILSALNEYPQIQNGDSEVRLSLAANKATPTKPDNWAWAAQAQGIVQITEASAQDQLDHSEYFGTCRIHRLDKVGNDKAEC